MTTSEWGTSEPGTSEPGVNVPGVNVLESWAPQACTLPTVERPLREAEFDAVFANLVRDVERQSEDRLRVELEPTPEVAARVADLVVRETSCCSFFTFALTATGGALHLDVTVEPAHARVLDAIAARA